MIVPVSGAIPSGEGLVAGLEKTEADVAIIVPSIMQDLGQSPDTLEYCAQHLNAILYCGGDLPQSIGDVVASKIKLFNQFGATELGLTPVLLSSQERDPGDWQYVQFHPDLGLEMRHVADDTFELYAVRDSRLESTQPTFTIFRDAQEYASRDLFVRHPSPSKKSLWKWKARADDIIVFLNGEKTNPISMEQHIVSSNPDVAATLVIGAQRFQAALLVELIIDKTELTSAERAVFLERLWPTVCEANRDAPSHARITKSHILFTSPQKPMMRAGKGTVQRAGTLEAYQDEIDALYKDADQMSEDTASPVPMLHDAADQVSLSQYIKETIISITGWPDLLDSENIFGLGMDSLHAIILVRNLNRALTLPDLAPSTLYTNPSVTALSHAIVALQNQRHEAEHTVHQNHLSMRSALLQEYKNKIDRLPLPSNAADGAYPSIVVLTGSTGALGTYILNSLLMSPMVSHIFCLNRAVNSLDLQISRNRYRQLPGDFPTDRVTFCTCDFSKPDLGLTADIYNTLTASNIIVIHNAWPVNFNMSIQSFRPQFDSVVNLIALTSRSKQPSRLFFISSISSVMSVGFTNSSIPERIVHTDLAVHPNGYAESKYLSELLLQYACEKLSLDCSVARVGQLTGAANNFGGWNPSEWFPSLLLSSAHIGFLPDSLGASFDKMEWIPIDYVADVVVELAIHEQQNGYPGGVKAACPSSRQAQVYQLVNPRTVHWRSMQTRVADTISRLTSTAVEIVDPKTWIVKVRDHLEITVADRGVEGALQSNPAAKLLDFYQQIMRPVDGAAVKWELEETLRHSKHFNDIPGLQEAWMDKWVEELLRPSHMA
ncbi:MAG: hypothetical protein LQ338_003135 [Usnochroma carphineum]|nr:MAG: hypothetical protein LQ338_003135 [Usnochroma carphineum]